MLDELADDDSHPIPKVDVIDYVRTIENGGAGYALVVASPLEPDQRSLRRLTRKLQAYVEDFFSKESKMRQGAPSPGKMWIFVNIHQDSCPEAFNIVKSHAPWILDHGIRLVVNTIDDG